VAVSPEERASSPLVVREAAVGKKAWVYEGEVPSLMLYWRNGLEALGLEIRGRE